MIERLAYDRNGPGTRARISTRTICAPGFDAVFLGVGLGATPAMGIPGEEQILDGLQYIEQSKIDSGAMRIGRNVVVIGAGNTAIDCATIAKRLGAERVTMVYRRTDREMTAYPHEYEFVKRKASSSASSRSRCAWSPTNGSVHRTGRACAWNWDAPDASGRRSPRRVHGLGIRHRRGPGGEGDRPGEARRSRSCLGLDDRARLHPGRTPTFETSIPGVFAGGDCIRAQERRVDRDGGAGRQAGRAAIHARFESEDHEHG